MLEVANLLQAADAELSVVTGSNHSPIHGGSSSEVRGWLYMLAMLAMLLGGPPPPPPLSLLPSPFSIPLGLSLVLLKFL